MCVKTTTTKKIITKTTKLATKRQNRKQRHPQERQLQQRHPQQRQQQTATFFYQVGVTAIIGTKNYIYLFFLLK